jgi:hypothetical protein
MSTSSHRLLSSVPGLLQEDPNRARRRPARERRRQDDDNANSKPSVLISDEKPGAISNRNLRGLACPKPEFGCGILALDRRNPECAAVGGCLVNFYERAA